MKSFYSLAGAKLYLPKNGKSLWLLKFVDGRAIGYKLSLVYSHPTFASIKKDIQKADEYEQRSRDADFKCESLRARLMGNRKKAK